MSEIKCWAHEIREPGCPKCCSESEAATQPDKLVVTQEDRDAAAEVLSAMGFSQVTDQDTRAGQRDHWLPVQAFAAHRQRAMNQAADERQEMCAKALADLRIGDCVDDQDIGWNAAVAEGEKVIRSIGKGAGE